MYLFWIFIIILYCIQVKPSMAHYHIKAYNQSMSQERDYMYHHLTAKVIKIKKKWDNVLKITWLVKDKLKTEA